MATRLNYSRLGKSGSVEYKSWNNIVLSPTTVAKRNQLKSGMDDFTSFTWRGVNAFDVFGAFIINNKNTLKFYNGPSFSNEYTKPQFESAAGQLVGVSFNVQKIDFTIGVYWICEDDYRKLIDWLDPYEISDLTFGFEPNYYYLVKLSSIGDAIRHIVGMEGSGNDKKYMYYTELKLTFEIQGEPCAYRNIAYEFIGNGDVSNTNIINNDNNRSYKYYFQLKNITNVPDNDFKSHLAMPLKYQMHFKLGTSSNFNWKIIFKDNIVSISTYTDVFHSFSCNGEEYDQMLINSNGGIMYWKGSNYTSVHSSGTSGSWTNQVYRTIYLRWEDWELGVQQWMQENATIEAIDNTLSLECNSIYDNFLDTRLFNIILKNLSYTDLTLDADGNYYLDLVYDSATGLLYWDRNDSKLFLLSRLSTASSGSRIVDYLESTSYKVLGTFNDWNFDLTKWQIELKVYSSIPIEQPFTLKEDTTTREIEEKNYYIEMRARTNLI